MVCFRTVSEPPTATSDEASNAEQNRWFAEQVYPHDSLLKAYLRSSFPSIRDVDDIAQESYLRIWRARAAHPIDSVKAFLFKISKHLAINQIRHRQGSPIDPVTDLSSLAVIEDGPDAAAIACTREELLLLAKGIDTLPARCREIFVLRRLMGLSQREIAEKLGLSEETVHAQVQRGLRRCERYLRRIVERRGFIHAQGR
jgi:RNA polymerase sigma-70 factor (ECF subfamily)